jgi:osmotically-inducible protein OsmY
VVPVVDGRDVELRGSVASALEARRAERVVSMVRGVRIVRTNMLVAEDSDNGGGDT